jgi:ribosomal protein S27E
MAEHSGNRETRMLPLYAARIEDLGSGDFVKVDCAACHHVALLTPEALLRVGLSSAAKVLDLKGRLRCRGCGSKGRSVVSIRRRRQGV